MNRTLRYLLPALVLILSVVSLHGQVLEVSLANLTDIRVTLDDNCQATIIPSEVIRGDLDADGDGTSVDLSLFTITVEDGVDNGPIVDGCGDYIYRVTADPSVTGFISAWGNVAAEDKTAPVLQPFGPTPDTLYCDAIDTISITMLAEEVSRCYTVDGQTGEVISSTLDSRLRRRLLAGGIIPTALDNCSSTVEICVNDVIQLSTVDPDCGPVSLTRTFTARDGSCGEPAPGESNPADIESYTIVFSRPTLDSLREDNIPLTVSISCDSPEAAGLAYGEVPAPRPIDLPFFYDRDGVTQIPLTLGAEGNFCGFAVTYTDGRPAPTCGNGYKVVRTYTVIDWCVEGSLRTFTQTVKVGDVTGPTISELPEPLEFSANGGDQCGAYLRVDLPGLRITDNCSGVATVLAEIFPNGNTEATPLGPFVVDLNDGDAELTNLLIPTGQHLLRYTAVDSCRNISMRTFEISIVDSNAPVAICEDGLNISLNESAEGFAILTPQLIDKGSYDNCSPVRLAIARVNSNDIATEDYGQEIFLYCEDLGTVRVGLRATDAGGLRNYCWLDVLVEDKNAPRCIAPDDVTVLCTDFRNNFPADLSEFSEEEIEASFGTPLFDGNCSNEVTQSVDGDINSCGVGQYTRTFTVTNVNNPSASITCVQTIDLIAVHDYTIKFPGDEEAFCGDLPELGELEVEENGCDLITQDMKIDTFLGDAAECYKLLVEYRIINWCEYNTLGAPYDLPRDFDGNNNNYEDVYLYVEPNDLTTLTDDVAYLDKDADRTNEGFRRVIDSGDRNDRNQSDNETLPYALDNSRGAFTYTQIIRIFDEAPPTITAEVPEECFGAFSANCTGTVNLSFEAEDDCSSLVTARVELDVDFISTPEFSRTRYLTDAEVTTNGSGDFFIELTDVPVGRHAVKIRAMDGCGNIALQVVEFCVTDEKAPTPICFSQLTVTLMPTGNGTGMAAIWASDYIASEVQDCSGEVAYAIYTEGDASESGFTPDPADDGLVLTCDSDQTTRVRVYAIDPAGRSDYCSAFVLVQRADNACDPGNAGLLAGLIFSEQGSTLGGVSVVLSTRDGNLRTESSLDGYYEFPDLEEGQDYTLDPILNDYTSHAQGVSTFDLVLIIRHILGTQELTSPYELMAADANNDQEISVQDIIAIRRLILGLYLEYPNTNAYRFVPADFVFPVTGNPWATSFPEVINENNLSGKVRDADFIAIMVGNVNGNAFPAAGGRSSSNFQVRDVDMVAGETYQVVVNAGAAMDLVGMQGTITLGNEAKLLNIGYGGFERGNVNPELSDRGLLPFSYNSANSLTAEAPLLTLFIQAKEDTKLSDVLSVSDLFLPSEGYTFGGNVTEIGIDFISEQAPSAQLSLAQNFPNPVVDRTSIRFTLPVSSVASLTVTDMTGKVVLRQDVKAFAGENEIVLHRSELGASGLLTYTITTADFTASRNMIVR